MFVLSVCWGIILDDQEIMEMNYGEKHRSISYLTLLTATHSKSKGKIEMWPVLHPLNAIGKITDHASSFP